MSEAEKRLMGHLAHAPQTRRDVEEVLAEYRAEVERLNGQVDAWKDASGLLVGEDPDGVTPEMLREDIARREREVSAARDAALEEAKADLVKRAEAAEEFGHTKTGEVWRNAASAVRALKSRPVECYLPESKVREVAQKMIATDRDGLSEQTLHVSDGTLREFVRRLGVDLDAKGETSGPLGCCGLYGTPHDACVHAKPAARQMCTCLGSCRGASGLGSGWKCALERGTP